MNIMRKEGNGAYTQTPVIVEGSQINHKSKESLMKSPEGWFTFFAGKWCWIYSTKRKRSAPAGYYAVVMGQRGPTPDAATLNQLEHYVKTGARAIKRR